MRNRICALLCLAAMLISALSPQEAAMAKKKPAMNKKSTTMYVGSSLTLKVKNVKKKAKITWKSSNKKVVKVSRKGKLKALKTGKATVTAKVSGKKVKCKVKVVKALERKDFALEMDDEKGNHYTNFIDYAKYWADYPHDVVTAEKGDFSSRGIGIGSSCAKVFAAYGETKKVKVTFSEAAIVSGFYDIELYGCSYYLLYTYREKGVAYQMLFGLDSKNKVNVFYIVEDFE